MHKGRLTKNRVCSSSVIPCGLGTFYNPCTIKDTVVFPTLLSRLLISTSSAVNKAESRCYNHVAIGVFAFTASSVKTRYDQMEQLHLCDRLTAPVKSILPFWLQCIHQKNNARAKEEGCNVRDVAKKRLKTGHPKCPSRWAASYDH